MLKRAVRLFPLLRDGLRLRVGSQPCHAMRSGTEVAFKTLPAVGAAETVVRPRANSRTLSVPVTASPACTCLQRELKLRMLACSIDKLHDLATRLHVG